MQHLGFPLHTIIIFILFVVAALFVDLVGHKNDKIMSLKSASLWSIFWVLVSVVFGVFLYYEHGGEMAKLFFAGYILEKSLSVDNLFVIMAIFTWFKIPQNYRHKVLYFGILGAIVFRLIFVAIGSGLFMLGSWMQIIFGLVVLYSAILMLKNNDSDDDEIEDYSNHLAYKFVYKYFSVFPKIVGHSFFINENTAQSELNKNPNLNFVDKKTWLIATPLFLCLCVIEVSDVMFAFDSVPAVIAVSQEPLIIYSAMIFAILGLRAMYFVLESLKKYLVYLEKSVIVLLFFIGFKIIINALNAMFDLEFEISSTISLIAIFTILGFGVLASVFVGKKQDISNL